MAKILLFNKPYEVLTQFTDDQGRKNLSHYIQGKQYQGFYPAGRLDYDSEGLLILTDDGMLQQKITSPKFKLPKTYWVQVEGAISSSSLKQLQQGITLNDGPTKPAKAALISSPNIWARNPPIRERKSIPTSWISLTITEGRNRQVRRMTAAIGHPTLRLIRHAIGHWTVSDLSPGELKTDTIHLPQNGKK